MWAVACCDAVTERSSGFRHGRIIQMAASSSPGRR